MNTPRCAWCGHKLTESEAVRRICDKCTDSVIAPLDQNEPGAEATGQSEDGDAREKITDILPPSTDRAD